jgi:hypothetical protein
MSANSTPAVIRFILQRDPHGDCGVRTAAMLAGVSYEDALIACAGVKPAVLTAGLSWPDMRRALRRLGVKTRLRAIPVDLSDETGILCLKRVALGVALRGEHLVYLWGGRILDGNGECWDSPEDYLRHYGYEATGLLVTTED